MLSLFRGQRRRIDAFKLGDVGHTAGNLDPQATPVIVLIFVAYFPVLGSPFPMTVARTCRCFGRGFGPPLAISLPYLIAFLGRHSGAGLAERPDPELVTQMLSLALPLALLRRQLTISLAFPVTLPR